MWAELTPALVALALAAAAWLRAQAAHARADKHEAAHSAETTSVAQSGSTAGLGRQEKGTGE